jgi:hypothetical protein
VFWNIYIPKCGELMAPLYTESQKEREVMLIYYLEEKRIPDNYESYCCVEQEDARYYERLALNCVQM